MIKNALAAVLVVLLLGAMAYAAFFVAPTDAKQGLIYRILFLHVSSAWTGLTAFFICFVANDSTYNTSTIILMIMPDIEGEKGISV